MNKGKPMLHRSKKTIQIVIKRLWSISAGVCFWSSFFAYLTFGGIVCYNLYKKIVRKAFAMRLDKFVSSQRNDISRSMVRELCRKGQVTVNGKVAKAADTKVSENDIVAVKGVEICYKKFVYIMMNKPQGVVCSTRDGESKTVLELVPPEMFREGLFPAGRLDKDTEGFVLLTDDGALAHRMLSPKTHVPKTYFVRLRDPWQENYAQAFAEGMTIDGGEKCLPAEFSASVNCPDECTVVLHEGKYHQVKRMFEKLGNKVVFLKRIKIGELPLDPDLPLGSCLEIMHKDVERLLTAKSFKCE